MMILRYKIAVVDDERDVLEKITELLHKYADSCCEDLIFEVDTYSTGDEFLGSDSKSYDVIFLDINMPGTNGLRVAKWIRDSNKTAIIFFCTHYAQYAVKGYEVDALGYILKPIEEQSFNRNLERMMKLLKASQHRQIHIKTVGGGEVIGVSDIIYIEVRIHNLFYYVIDESNSVAEFKTRGSMQEMTDSLGELGFARCGNSFLVNLRHVRALKGGEVSLDGGINLTVSRKFLRGFTDSFMKYLNKNGTLNV